MTWLNAGELGPLSEVCPTGYTFFNTTRSVGRGGGLATIFRNNLKCRLLASELFSSFEVQLFQMDGCNPLLFILVYRPPKYNKDFISEFSDFLSSVVPNADRLLILGDFNIHVCCPSKPMVKEFLRTTDTFNLIQSVGGPTHNQGHTLDLILSYGLLVSDVGIKDFFLSDHKSIIFNIAIPSPVLHRASACRCTRFFNSSTSEKLLDAYITSPITHEIESDCLGANPDKLVNKFNGICSNILDAVAPFKLKKN